MLVRFRRPVAADPTAPQSAVRRRFLSVRPPDVRYASRAVGAGRLLVGGAFLAAPVPATRILGMDSATAKRVGFLARMMAARDVAIGAGTAASAHPRPWLLAGAFADATDAAVLAAALRAGRARGPVAAGVVGGAAAVALFAAAAAVGSRRPG